MILLLCMKMKIKKLWPAVILFLIVTVVVTQIFVSLGFKSPTTATSTFPVDRRRIILIGDSITEQSYSITRGGWGAGLADWYHQSADVFNRGYSGYNSEWVLAIVQKILPIPYLRIAVSPNKDIILAVILLGSNDSVSPGNHQYVSLPEFELNIRKIILHLRRLNPSIAIILITPPTVNHDYWPTRDISQVSQYASNIQNVAKDMDCGLVNLWEGDTRVYLTDLIDGLHLSQTGNLKVLEGLKAVIRSKFTHIAPENNALGLPNLYLQFPHSSVFRELTKLEAKSLILS